VVFQIKTCSNLPEHLEKLQMSGNGYTSLEYTSFPNPYFCSFALYQIFTLNHKKPTASLKINNKPVVQTQEAKYLGMYLDGKFTWKNHVERTVKKT
jgi:hypothetical protein